MKTRPFSIFLLKQGYNASNSIKPTSDLLSNIGASNLPESASLYIADNMETTPWWVNYFGIESNLTQKNKGALIFLPVDDRCFALSFGFVSHHLIDASYEYDFGLKVTLNSLDPQELRSADIVDPSAARRKRMQLPITSDLTYLDFDSNSEILKSLTGKVKSEYVNLFKNATGSISLRVGLKIEPENLLGLCQQLLTLYNSEEYLTSFPNIQKIMPEKDPVKVAILNNILLENFINRNQDLLLSVPEIIDYKDNIFCTFSGKAGIQKVYSDVSLNGFYDYLDDRGINEITLDILKKTELNLCDSDGKTTGSYSVYRSLIFDTPLQSDNHIYHLCEGEWYRIDTDYLAKLKESIDAVCEDTNLIAYNHDNRNNGVLTYSEENYNQAAIEGKENFFCLDQTNISPDGYSQIEPCDILTFNEQAEQCILYHIKISSRSSQLSHLFNQGANSIELLYLEETCRDKLKELLQQQINNDLTIINNIIDKKNYKVIFGIITKKDKNLRSDNLPLFSKISLLRVLRALELSKTEVSLTFIQDDSLIKEGYSKHPQIIAIIKNDEHGKKELYPFQGQVFSHTIKINRCDKNIKEHDVDTKFKVYVKENENGELTYLRSGGYEVIQ
ncbi:TIGR04141 family sporadically distributed protein [Entomomonas asaccharolytica]|uniref:TIGR04141 family sporadically distributed protein n=1 Tax=Entomomonas asaccharolytica TaxID=2785331 RepID=A0A974NHX9_9GAMM|nr:TIGR04141 family sporadically distributed protein [Entomomonas asaccharolytica]QQP87071.1 TIGR04141 family sporadically distributed protein [Entomomonas asaccharolytica]